MECEQCFRKFESEEGCNYAPLCDVCEHTKYLNKKKLKNKQCLRCGKFRCINSKLCSKCEKVEEEEFISYLADLEL